MEKQQAIEWELKRIDDLVDKWHEGGSSIPLVEFLGMSPASYQLYLRDERRYALLKLELSGAFSG